MLYEIAQTLIEITPEYDLSKKILASYACGESAAAPDFCIKLNKSELDRLCGTNPHLTPAEVEQICLAECFSREMLRFGGVFLHASALSFRGRAYLFSAPSQTGKSTHTGLWQKVFGSNEVKIINDDRPIIKAGADIPAVFGTPFSGGSGKEINVSVPLGAVFFLRRGRENSVRKLKADEITPLFLNNTVNFVSKAYMSALLENIETLIKKTSFYELTCTEDVRAVLCAYNVIKTENKNEN